LGTEADLIKEAPLDDDAGWDFSETANSKAADKMGGK
jgi:hypothetical protein